MPGSLGQLACLPYFLVINVSRNFCVCVGVIWAASTAHEVGRQSTCTVMYSCPWETLDIVSQLIWKGYTSAVTFPLRLFISSLHDLLRHLFNQCLHFLKWLYNTHQLYDIQWFAQQIINNEHSALYLSNCWIHSMKDAMWVLVPLHSAYKEPSTLGKLTVHLTCG